MTMEKLQIHKGTISFGVLFLTALLIAYFARYALLTSLIGIGIGVLLEPLLRKLMGKFHLPKSVSTLILIIGMILITATVVGTLYYILADQVSSLAKRGPVIFQKLNDWLTKIFDTYPWIRERLDAMNFRSAISSSLMSVAKFFQLSFMAISSLVFALVIGLYTAVDGKHLFSSTVEAFPPQRRTKAKSVLEDCAKTLRGWFNAQLLDMAIIGALTAIGLWIAGVEYWAVFGILTAALEIIPYVGIMIVVTAASLITIVSDPSQVPLVLIIFFITQQLEGNLILPLVMKGRVELPVVPLLIFMLVLGTFFGIIGVFLSPPLLALSRTLYIDLYLERFKQIQKVSTPV